MTAKRLALTSRSLVLSLARLVLADITVRESAISVTRARNEDMGAVGEFRKTRGNLALSLPLLRLKLRTIKRRGSFSEGYDTYASPRKPSVARKSRDNPVELRI